MTLLEITISSLIVAVIVGGAYSVLFTGVDTYGTGSTIVGLQQHANRVLDDISRRLAVSGQATLSPVPASPFATPVVTFQEGRGYSGGALQWGPISRIELVHAADDPDDGVDNNGNGLVDECEVVWRENVGASDERREVLTRWVREYLEGERPNGSDDNGNGLVDERGLAFARDGDVWTIRLTLERPDANGHILVRTVETSVIPRN